MTHPDDNWFIWNLSMLALLVWREARGEPFMGKVAVAWTVRNRVEHPKWWGDSYSEVMAKKWQYSAMAAPGDPQLVRWPVYPDASFTECLDAADRVMHGTIAHPFPGADSYYATSIAPPTWATEDKFVGAIGSHLFFNMDGDHPENTN